MSEWAHRWKMQVTKVYFLWKLNQESPLPLDFHDNSVQTIEVNKNLSVSVSKKLILIFILITK